MTRLGINIDHIATVRQARHENFPDPIEAALAAIEGGAQGITAHLREDRRHIQDKDIARLKAQLSVPFNMEMAATEEIINIALKVRPEWTCVVPEKRAELTTEGGLSLAKNKKHIEKCIQKLHAKDIQVSLFLDPDPNVIQMAHDVGADAVEIHTGHYAQLWHNGEGSVGFKDELSQIMRAAHLADKLNLVVNAGHGLDANNVGPLIRGFEFNEFNIGFSIISRALMIGMKPAVLEMKKEMVRQVTCVES